MKKLLAIIFLLILLQSIGGYFVLLNLQQAHCREEAEKKMKAEIPAEQLVKFVFSDAEFKQITWERTNKEFFFNHQLYDIIRHEIIANKHILLCFDDKQESKIKRQLIEHQQQQSKNTYTALYQLLFQLYDIPNLFACLFSPNDVV